MTNYERNQNMNIEEMAKFINSIVAYCFNDEESADCLPIIEKWLNSWCSLDIICTISKKKPFEIPYQDKNGRYILVRADD